MSQEANTLIGPAPRSEQAYAVLVAAFGYFGFMAFQGATVYY